MRTLGEHVEYSHNLATLTGEIDTADWMGHTCPTMEWAGDVIGNATMVAKITIGGVLDDSAELAKPKSNNKVKSGIVNVMAWNENLPLESHSGIARKL